LARGSCIRHCGRFGPRSWAGRKWNIWTREHPGWKAVSNGMEGCEQQPVLRTLQGRKCICSETERAPSSAGCCPKSKHWPTYNCAVDAFWFHMVLSGEARACCGILEMACPTPGLG